METNRYEAQLRKRHSAIIRVCVCEIFLWNRINIYKQWYGHPRKKAMSLWQMLLRQRILLNDCMPCFGKRTLVSLKIQNKLWLFNSIEPCSKPLVHGLAKQLSFANLSRKATTESVLLPMAWSHKAAHNFQNVCSLQTSFYRKKSHLLE